MALFQKILPDRIRRQYNCWRFERFEKDRKKEGSSLAAFDYYRCIFVHIPKTGGVSVSDALWGHLGGVHKSLQTYAGIFGRATVEEYFKFTIVRNPWDRLVSAYTFLKAGGLHAADAAWAKKHLSEYPDFEAFVLQGLESPSIQKGIHFVPQTDLLLLDGSLRMDFIGRFEHLEEDFRFIAGKLGFKDLVLPHKNSSSRAAYQTYYTEASRAKVAEVYRRDIELLGYTF